MGLPPVEYLILESTYGGRFHKSAAHVIRIGQLMQQQHQLLRAAHGKRRHDNATAAPASPAHHVAQLPAVNVTEVFRKHVEWLHRETPPISSGPRGIHSDSAACNTFGKQIGRASCRER